MRLRLNKSVLQGILFPVTLFAFAGVGIEYANSIFTTSTRWFFLVVLAIVLIKSGRALGLSYTRSSLPALAYFGWCLISGLWSIVPELSVAKGFASISTMTLLFAAGRYWATGWSSNPTLTYLVPIGLAAFASVFVGDTVHTGQGSGLYEGLAGNPNYMGMIAAASLPLALYYLYKAFNTSSSLLHRGLTVLAVMLVALLLWRAGSRSAIACSAVIIAFAILALRPGKIVVGAVLAVTIGTMTVIVAPEVPNEIYARLIVKYSPDNDVLYTRRQVWERSMLGAQEGGWIGLGYGTAYGHTNFSGGLTATTYGREKGNSQLAVVEETGIVGVILYAILLLSLISSMIEGFRLAPNGEMRMEAALVNGLAFGLLVQSCFEAWWTAPGSAESAIFWATVGVSSGLHRQAVLARSSSARRWNVFRPTAGPALYRR